MAFSHRFDPTTLREYDIRGTVGRTLFEDDAFAIGRCFGSLVARNGGVTVAVLLRSLGTLTQCYTSRR